MFASTSDKCRCPESDEKQRQATATTEYCAELQQWMWQYYWGNVSWQSWAAFPFPGPGSFPPPVISTQTPGSSLTTSGGGHQVFDSRNWYNQPYPFSFPASFPHAGGAQTEPGSAQTPTTDARPAQRQNGTPPQAGWDAVCFKCLTLSKITF